MAPGRSSSTTGAPPAGGRRRKGSSCRLTRSTTTGASKTSGSIVSQNPPHSDGEVSASYADGGVIGDHLVPMTPPSRVTAPPPHQNGEEKSNTEEAHEA